MLGKGHRALLLLRDIAIYGVAYLLFHTLAYASYYVPSDSMRPTLEVGDRLLVSKFAYGYSGQSLPFGFDLSQGRLFERLPRRGDVVVFKGTTKAEGDVVYIKRVIGLPGDTIRMTGGRLSINGRELPRRLIRTVETVAWGHPVLASDYEETLPGGRTHVIREFGDNYPLDDTKLYVVPKGHLFMMGDNRDNSSDSRPSDGFGMVPLSRLIGRAEILTFSLADCARINEDHCHFGLPLGRYAAVIR